MRQILLLPVIVLLVGCGTPEVWHKSGVQCVADIQKDFSGCRLKARQVSNPLAAINLGFALAEAGRQEEMIRDCMFEKGYSLIKVNEVPKGEFYLKK